SQVTKWNPETKSFEDITIHSIEFVPFPFSTDVYGFLTLTDSGAQSHTGFGYVTGSDSFNIRTSSGAIFTAAAVAFQAKP
ncbi:hypothetical protein, partial [Staphylococcus aureus]|uniref:hypothetical protein n=1 Tax=Staphylococcus aureus TaxID=1280 RepID=UPI0026EF9E22